jgi:trehalose 6-phosphate synthase/phosphatase
MAEKDRRLILVSNRLPIKTPPKGSNELFVESDGGLVSAIKSYFDKEGTQGAFGEKLWVGVADFSPIRWKKFQSQPSALNYQIVPLFIDDSVFNKYYNGFCNGTIWPLFHYFPSFAQFESVTFQAFEEVNRLFCQKLFEILRPTDTLWIHDYHLMLLPGMIRKHFPDVSVGFFLHIPFPAFDVFRMLHRTWKEKIIHGLLGADLVGFHTHEYVQHFLKTMRMVSGHDHRYREIFARKTIVKADLFPLGIDFEKFDQAGSDEKVAAHKASIHGRFNGMKIIFSVDRLDYTKGVTHRLSGFERFLELFPDMRAKVVFVMVVVPSRQIVSKYNERRKLIEEQVGRINGKYSTLEWQPIIYRYSQLSFEELCALYQVAHVALITPLRDGMNLVAKEYVASRSRGDGVLILSELAGAANELGEAMLVNPTDRDEVARSIERSLKVSPEDQTKCMTLMRERLKEKNVLAWVHNFMEDLRLIKLRQQDVKAREVSSRVEQEIIQAFHSAPRRLLLLDYDGTLTPIRRKPSHSTPTGEVIGLLRDLTQQAGTEVVIISGRTYHELEDWLGYLPLHIVAEHGASLRLKGQQWEHHTDMDHSWKDLIRNTFELYASRSPGSFVEEKLYTMAWHYREMEPALGFTRSRELLDNLHHMIRNSRLNVLDGNKVIEVRAAGIDKGAATRKMMQLMPSDFIFAVGDDQTDEDIFHVLNGKAYSIRIGQDLTAARYRATSQQQVFELLMQMSRVS